MHFLGFGGKNAFFFVLTRKCVVSGFGGKCFLRFGRKVLFGVLTGICVFWVLVEKCGFTGLAKKIIFMKMCVLCVFAEKRILRFWRESVFFCFCEKIHFLVIVKNIYAKK